MRILIVCQPLWGHVNPVLPLARAALAAGHEVVIATGPDMAPLLQRLGFVAWGTGLSHHELCGDGLPSSWLAYFEAAARHRLVQLVSRALVWSPDLVVHEETELAAPVVAALSGARSVVHGLGVMPSPHTCALFMQALQRLGELWGVGDADLRARETPYLHLCPLALQEDRLPFWEQALPLRPSVGGAGPARDPGKVRLERLPFRETLHLTLGTVFHRDRPLFAKIIGALRSLPCNLVVTTGPDTELGVLGAQPPHVLVAPYLPHDWLLPQCSLLVSHGGAGAMFGALTYGLPQLLLPQGADQFVNAEACRRAGVGLALAPAAVTPEALRDAVSRLLQDEGFRQRARRVGDEIAAMPDAASVLAQLVAAQETLHA